MILQTEGQEIGSHTFCHYYCLEPGQTSSEFVADAQAAQATITTVCGPARSLVFPRNQFNGEYLDACAKSGIQVIRGNEDHWSYAASGASGNSPWKRSLRLLDTYVNVAGCHASTAKQMNALWNVPSSRFLRPYHPKLKRLETVRAARITNAMESAFHANQAFHLWWHPHNFGQDLAANLRILNRVLTQYARLRERYDAPSYTMTEYANYCAHQETAFQTREKAA